MKVNKKNPKHWLIILRSSLNVFIAIILSKFLISSKSKSVAFYGHKLNGNLKPLADYLSDYGNIEVYFVTMGNDDYSKLLNEYVGRIKILNTMYLSDIIKIARSDVIITDRKANILSLFNIFTKLLFIDVWHGIPYKGFTPKDFKFLNRYREIWVSSPSLKNMYRNMYSVDNRKIFATGYARVDSLVKGIYDKSYLKNKYGISPKYKKIVLVAPTWQQDDRGRNILPFGVSEHDFFNSMNKVGEDTNALFIFRAHLNVGDSIKFSSLTNVINMSHSEYPNAEEFLAIADLLVTDWSSIAFDYLVLRRPTIFLDVKPPFKNGFSLGPEYRFGKIVKNYPDYINSLYKYLNNPVLFKKKYQNKMNDVIDVVYGGTLDGGVCKRQFNRLIKIIN